MLRAPSGSSLCMAGARARARAAFVFAPLKIPHCVVHKVKRSPLCSRASSAAADQTPSQGGPEESDPSISSTASTTQVDESNRNPISGIDMDDSAALPANFCIIESRETVTDFANLDAQSIRDNLEARKTKIFLLLEEMRRLRIQQRLRTRQDKTNTAVVEEVDPRDQKVDSAIPLLPPVNEENINQYYAMYGAFVGTVIFFGGILAPLLEVRLGLGGTSYAQFIEGVHLPKQLSQVDPIVASFCGGAVGVISALLVVEVNNVKEAARKRCLYCAGTGYLTCGTCAGQGICAGEDGGEMNTCGTCKGTGKVSCPSCLCTGMAMATEHDPRIDPFGE
mmetsp:Transcript_1791/g.4039  ORF Transcript_1791/g.4039 Transcript_1791/m.4039 type:complete len:336 (-) Transcript_1791:27-1034(-)